MTAQKIFFCLHILVKKEKYQLYDFLHSNNLKLLLSNLRKLSFITITLIFIYNTFLIYLFIDNIIYINVWSN